MRAVWTSYDKDFSAVVPHSHYNNIYKFEDVMVAILYVLLHINKLQVSSYADKSVHKTESYNSAWQVASSIWTKMFTIHCTQIICIPIQCTMFFFKGLVMIWKSEVHDENINDFSIHPPTCTKRCYCKCQSGSNSSAQTLHITLLRLHIYKVIIYVCDWALKHFIKSDLVGIFKCQLMT
jgi:hypothetical protein